MTTRERLEVWFNDNRSVRLVSACVLAIAAVAAIAIAIEKALTRELDLYVILNASRSLLDGSDIYTSPAANGAYYLYLPLLASLFIPLALLPHAFAGVLWTVVCIALIGWSLNGSIKLIAGDSYASLTSLERLLMHVLPMIFCADAISSEVGNAQVNCLILALAVLALKLARSGRENPAGVLLGFAAIAKVFTAPLLLHELLAKRFRIIAGSLLAAIVGMFLPALVTGWERNLEYVTCWTTHIALYNDLTTHRSGFAGNASLTAVLTRLLTDVPAFNWNGADYHLNIAALDPGVLGYLGIATAVAAMALVAIYWAAFRNRSTFISYWGGAAVAFCVAPLITPVAERPHFLMLLPAYVYVSWLCLGKNVPSRVFYALLAAAFVLSTFTLKLYVGSFLGSVFWSLGASTLADLCLIAAIFVAARCQNSRDLTDAG